MSNRTTRVSYDTEWSDGEGISGVHTHGGEGLTWWYRPGGPNGHFGEVGRDQTFEDFRLNGPAVPSVPQEVVDALKKALGN